jgi:predicted enzyme related to lactoylglutathione lyase
MVRDKKGGNIMNTKTLKEPIVESLAGAGLHVKDLAKMSNWYGELLNMHVQEIDPEIPFYLIDMDNRVNLMLDDYRNMPNKERFASFGFKTSDIKKAYHLVNESGIKIVRDLEEPHPGLAYFNIEDSEGNILMIQQSDWVNPNPIQQDNPNHPIMNRINTIIISVKDLKRATEWYSKLLGYPIKPDRQDGGPIYWFEMDTGTGILLDDNRNNQDLPAFPTIMLKATNIHDAYAFVKEKNIEVVREIQYDHYFIIKDIEGNTIMICLG